VSVVIPVFNEETCIGPLWDRLRPVLLGLGRSWEVVFVDDGSTDASPARLSDLRSAEPRVRVMKMARNQGQSAALDAGFRAARGGWIVTLDADLQNPPEEIPRLFEAAAGVDLVFGVTGHTVRDTGCSLKLYRADALRRIPLFRGMHRFLPTLFVFHGYRIREVEVEHQPRVSGTSKYGNLDRAWRGLMDCFAVRWMRRRSLDYRVEEIDVGDGPF
jgi:glycosyltransferase involved in cell wall biosynthesis